MQTHSQFFERRHDLIRNSLPRRQPARPPPQPHIPTGTEAKTKVSVYFLPQKKWVEIIARVGERRGFF